MVEFFALQANYEVSMLPQDDDVLPQFRVRDFYSADSILKINPHVVGYARGAAVENNLYEVSVLVVFSVEDVERRITYATRGQDKFPVDYFSLQNEYARASAVRSFSVERGVQALIRAIERQASSSHCTQISVCSPFPAHILGRSWMPPKLTVWQRLFQRKPAFPSYFAADTHFATISRKL